MAEQIISPGVFQNENVPIALEAAAAPIGAAIVGPSLKGPIGIPTTVTTYSDFKQRFGGPFVSGGIEYSYFTNISAQNYFKQGGSNLLITRVASGSAGFTTATSSNAVSERATGINGVPKTSVKLPLPSFLYSLVIYNTLLTFFDLNFFQFQCD